MGASVLNSRERCSQFPLLALSDLLSITSGPCKHLSLIPVVERKRSFSGLKTLRLPQEDGRTRNWSTAGLPKPYLPLVEANHEVLGSVFRGKTACHYFASVPDLEKRFGCGVGSAEDVPERAL